MVYHRRRILEMGAGALALASFSGMPSFSSVAAEEAVAAVTGGQPAADDGVEIDAPEIAENGNTVPISVSAPGAVEITFLAVGNPSPDVATFKFGPLAGARSASTRIRLATTQDVIAVAKMEDGTFKKAVASVKVTIGGCGG